MDVYYNDIQEDVCKWAKYAMHAGIIPYGHLDIGSIAEVDDEVIGFTQCHFFAGIGGWAYALKLAGWPEHLPVWTGSCPCQPFAGTTGPKIDGVWGAIGDKDPRHLWPQYLRLIDKHHPPVVFGEQVASADGRVWLSGVRADMEALGYAFGASDLCAAGIGAPHIRQRLYWVGHAISQGLQGYAWDGNPRHESGRIGKGTVRPTSEASCLYPWSEYDTLSAGEGAFRRVQSGAVLLAHGIPARVLRMRGYGNSIVPQLAALFIRAYMKSVGIEGAA